MKIPNNIQKEHLERTKQFWLFSPGENASKWDEFYKGNIMGLGWDDLGDLNNYNSKEEIAEELQKLSRTNSSKKNDATANYDFKKNITVGDIIIAKKGRSEYLGYGIVSSDYYYDSSRKKFQKCRKVNWIKKGVWIENEGKTALKTLTNITKHSDYVNKLIQLIGIETDNIMKDPIKSIIENYKVLISKTQLKDEIYKWELINQYKGRPNIEASDFYKEIKSIKFKNLIYAMGVSVLNHLTREKPEELRQLFINLYDESKDLTERVTSFNKDTLKIYRALGETLQHHQDERSIASYLTFHNPDKYTFYKSSFYTKYCKLLNIEVAKKNEKYTHYLKLIDDLIEKYIKTDIELIEQVKGLIPDYYDGTNHKLLAQDILYQMLDKKVDSNSDITNMKEKFKKHLHSNNRKGSQKASSYLRAIDLLDTILNSKNKEKLEGFKSIYNITSPKIISKLHLFILEEQKKNKGIFENEEPISYWRDRFYSAALNSYLDFLKSIDMRDNPNTNKQINLNTSTFHKDCTASNLTYSKQLITRYIASLATKPFVLLSGLSGSGKTKLAEAFAKWICECKEQYALIPVGADWTNREPLLGYPNALKDNEYIKPDNEALDLLLRAQENPSKPYFLILDEMNLSHVERYFADFLSTMESKNAIPLHNIAEEIQAIPKEIKLPQNLFIIGTVNIDETTYMFSPKVLDRANTIEFRVSDTDIASYLKNPKGVDLETLSGKGAAMATDFVAMATATKNGKKIEEDYQLDNDSQRVLSDFFKELQKAGAEFGYRTAFEISKLIYKLDTLGLTATNDKIDVAIMQKMLPKLHGSRTKLTRTLKPLAQLCLEDTKEFEKKYFENFDNINFKNDQNIKYKLAFEKIMRMYRNAVENGFASYAEA